jgi:hypothetical protein
VPPPQPLPSLPNAVLLMIVLPVTLSVAPTWFTMPPPYELNEPDADTVLLKIVLLVTLSEPASLRMPPPEEVAVLFVTVLLVSVSVSLLLLPPL